MSLENCAECALFELMADQRSTEKLVNEADKLLNDKDPLMSRLAMAAYRAGMSGRGVRSCSASTKEVFATARCASPGEFVQRR